jgi:NitT/TauT family transport system permease protein
MKWLLEVRGRIPLWATFVFGVLPILLAVLWWWENTRPKPVWRTLGSRALDRAADKATIDFEVEEAFDTLRFELDAGDLELSKIQLSFNRGQPFLSEARLAFKDGARSHTIQLPPDIRRVRAVDFSYTGAGGTLAVHGLSMTPDISPTVLPSPGEVLASIRGTEKPRKVEGLFQRDLGANTWASAKRVGKGFLMAVAIVLPLGILMGAFNSVRACFNPIVTASGYVPIVALVPLTMSWWGIDESQKVNFLALAFSIYILPLVVKAIDGVPDVYLRTARTLGASRVQLVTRVLFPIAAPDIWHALRLAFGVGWTYLVLVELLVIEQGLGAMIGISQRRGPKEHIYLILILITVIAFVVDLVWEQVGRFLFRYKRSTA